MTETPQFEAYLDALRDDFPSRRDEARLRRRLAGAGFAVASSVAAKAAAGATGVAKVATAATLLTRLGNLPLLAQLGLVTAGTAAVATGPVIAFNHWTSKPTLEQAAPTRGAKLPTLVSTARRSTPDTAVGVGETRASMGDDHASVDSVGSRAVPKRVDVDRAAVGAPRGGDGNAGARHAQPDVDTSSAVTTAERPESEASNDRAGAAPDPRQLGEETRLIDAALSAIRSGELATAARLLDEHGARFPHAKLAKERERATRKLEAARGRAR